MGRTRQQKRKEARRKKQQEQLRQKKRKLLKEKLIAGLSSCWKVLIGLSVFLGLAASLATFSSRISVSSLVPLDPSAPFSTPFTIKNEGYLSLNSVDPSCAVRDVQASASDSAVIGMSDYTTRFRYEHPPISRLAMGDTDTFFCPVPFNFTSPITYADIAIVVSYRQSYLPFRQEKLFRFVTAKGADAKLHWIPDSINE